MKIELLSPAKTVEIGREAVLHGADAVYIGGPAFGARANAGNEVCEIAALCGFAHRYDARIFATLNTILHDSELEPARRLIWQLYEAGVDALIVQDMGLLELDLPPIEIHASTQTDIRSVEKAKFLSDCGFSQIVLARELSLDRIREIAGSVDATLEFFVHGALCVAYSGQCYISHAQTGRSANRGDCSQACRLPYTLKDGEGRVVSFEKHLLSMKDNDQSSNLEALVEAGIRSFKIEGRYKDAPYVKNVTAHYRKLLDQLFERRPEFSASSSGKCSFRFQPDPDRTFHRGSTDYFVNGRKEDIGAFDSPKFMGKPIGKVRRVGEGWIEIDALEPMHNGDGICFLKKRELVGGRINRAEKVGNAWRLHPNAPFLEGLQVGMEIFRNLDHEWEQALLGNSAERKIDIDLHLGNDASGFVLALTDEDGNVASEHFAMKLEAAKSEVNFPEQLARLGGTLFRPRKITIDLSGNWFIPASALNAARRNAVEKLEAVRLGNRVMRTRKPAVEPPVPYPEDALSYLANVYNHKAREFYEKHGVKVIDAAYEAHEEAGEVSLMITRHCLRFSFHLCPKQAKGVTGVQGQVRAEPMTLAGGGETFTLKFDCRACEMHVMGKMRKSVLASPPPSIITFHR